MVLLHRWDFLTKALFYISEKGVPQEVDAHPWAWLLHHLKSCKKKNQTVNWKAVPQNDVMKQIDRTSKGTVLPLSPASAAPVSLLNNVLERTVVSFTEVLCRKFQPGNALFPGKCMGVYMLRAAVKMLAWEQLRSLFKWKQICVQKSCCEL